MLRTSNMLPALARVWTRVHEYLHVRRHGRDSLTGAHTLLETSKMQPRVARRGKQDTAAAARIAKVLGRVGRGNVKLSTLKLISSLKSGAAREEHDHDQHVRILENLSTAMWACAMGGVPNTDPHWTRLNVCKLAVMMMDEHDPKVARAGIGLLSHLCSYQVPDGEPRPDTGASRRTSSRGSGRPGTSASRSNSPQPQGVSAIAQASLQSTPSIRFNDTPTIHLHSTAEERKADGHNVSLRPSQSWRKAQEGAGVFRRAVLVELDKPLRTFLGEHGCRALLRRAREDAGDPRTVFVSLSAINQLLATGGRSVALELWRAGAAKFIISALGSCYEGMAQRAEEQAEAERKAVEEVAASAEQVEEEDTDDGGAAAGASTGGARHSPAGTHARGPPRAHAHGRRKSSMRRQSALHRLASSHATKGGVTVLQGDEHTVGEGDTAKLIPGVHGRMARRASGGFGAPRALEQRNIHAVTAGSHRNLPTAFRSFRKAVSKYGSSVRGAMATRVTKALTLDERSRRVLRHCASGFMGLSACYGQRRKPEFVEAVVFMLRHKDPGGCVSMWWMCQHVVDVSACGVCLCVFGKLFAAPRLNNRAGVACGLGCRSVVYAFTRHRGVEVHRTCNLGPCARSKESPRRVRRWRHGSAGELGSAAVAHSMRQRRSPGVVACQWGVPAAWTGVCGTGEGRGTASTQASYVAAWCTYRSLSICVALRSPHSAAKPARQCEKPDGRCG